MGHSNLCYLASSPGHSHAGSSVRTVPLQDSLELCSLSSPAELFKMTDSVGPWCGLFIWIFKSSPGNLMFRKIEKLFLREFADLGSSQSRSHHATNGQVPLLLVTAPEIMLEEGPLNREGGAWVSSLDTGLKRESVQSPNSPGYCYKWREGKKKHKDKLLFHQIFLGMKG